MYIVIFVFGLVGTAFKEQDRLLMVMKGLISVIVLVYLINKLIHPLHAEDARLDRLASYFFLGAWVYLFRDKIRLHPIIAISLWSASLALHQYNAFVPLFRISLAYTVFLLAFHPTIRLHNFGKYGDFSFGIYIYAFPIQQLIIWRAPAITSLYLFSMGLILTLPMAVLSWVYIEKPALRLKGRLPLFSDRNTSDPSPQYK